MQPRLKIYQEFIEKDYLKSLSQNKDYSLAGLKDELKQKIKNKQFKRIVFCGMGCSAAVGQMLKGFLINQKIPLSVEVVNGYDVDYLIDKQIIKDNKSLIIIKSYSGCSQEPIKFFKKIKKITNNIIFLTSGGELEQIAVKYNISIIRSKLKNHIKQYDLLHAPQHFVILLDIFFKLGLIKRSFEKELTHTARYIKKEFNQEKIKTAKQTAKKLKNRQIVFLANPQWHLTLLRLVVMHFNEMAATSACANLFHEFTHCEVTSFSAPKMKLAAVIFQDSSEDEYSKNKMENLVDTLSQKHKRLTQDFSRGKNIEIVKVNLNQDSFLKKLFFSLLLMQYVAYFLGCDYNIKSRQLISQTSFNPWYSKSDKK